MGTTTNSDNPQLSPSNAQAGEPSTSYVNMGNQPPGRQQRRQSRRQSQQKQQAEGGDAADADAPPRSSHPGNLSNSILQQPLTPQELATLKEILRHNDLQSLQRTSSTDSDYPEFPETTHAWAVFADNPDKSATSLDRTVGVLIIAFQLFTYGLFVNEAIEDYEAGQVAVTTSHADCMDADEMPNQNFVCEAEFTNDIDAFVAFFMLGIFLTGDFLQAFRVIRDCPPHTTTFLFASLAGIEIVCAYLSACVAISYQLYIGEVTDAVEVGVGLLFIRDLSARAYAGIRYGKTKQYKVFFSVLAILVIFGMFMDPLCERLFAAPRDY